MRDQKVVLFTCYLIILMAVVGCEGSVEGVLPPDMWENAYLSVKTECSSSEYCQYVVTIGPFEEDRQLDLALFANYGIKFRDDLMQNEGVVLSDDGRRAMIEDIEVQLEGTRVVHIPFSIRSENELTGEYIVDVILTSADQADPIIDPLQIKAFIQNGGDNLDDYRSPQLLRTQAEFNNKYPFLSDGKVTSFIRLDQNQRPRQGRLYVKLVAPHADYCPVITLHSDGVESKRFIPLLVVANRGGSRVVEVPFRIVEGERPIDGVHVFSISIVEENDVPIHQTLPVAVEIVSEPDVHQQQWLVRSDADVASTTAGKTAVDHLLIGLGKGGELGDPVSGYSETVTTGGQLESYPIDVVDADQSPDGILPEPTYTPTAIPPEPTQTPLPLVVAGGTSGGSISPNADAKTAVFDPRCSEWNRTISATSNLTLLDVYHQHVEESIPDMSVNHFVLAFRLCNRIGTEVDVVVLGAGEMYYLPNNNHP